MIDALFWDYKKPHLLENKISKILSCNFVNNICVYLYFFGTAKSIHSQYHAVKSLFLETECSYQASQSEHLGHFRKKEHGNDRIVTIALSPCSNY